MLWYCCGLGLLLQFVDCVFPLFDRPLRQALHDKRAQTVVVQVPRTPADTPLGQPTDRADPREVPHDRPPAPPAAARLTRADLDALPNYVPGRSPADLARELGLPEAIKLASNEVPYGPLPGVVEAVTEAAASSHRYPDMGVVALRDALAERYGVDADRIATGCGSVALAEHLVRATCLPGDELLYSWRSFEAYPIIAATSGATSVRVPNDAGHGHDLAAMAAAVTDRTRMILVCNPNNPTGTSLRRAELDRFLDAVPDDVLVVLDEAYREFVTDPEVPDGC